LDQQRVTRPFSRKESQKCAKNYYSPHEFLRVLAPFCGHPV